MAVRNGALQDASWANAADRVFGRIWGPISAMLEGSAAYRLAWMPAHCSTKSIGKKFLSNGFPLHAIDLTGNAYVDTWCKAAASAQASPVAELKRIADTGKYLSDIAKWIGIGTAAATRLSFLWLPSPGHHLHHVFSFCTSKSELSVNSSTVVGRFLLLNHNKK